MPTQCSLHNGKYVCNQCIDMYYIKNSRPCGSLMVLFYHRNSLFSIHEKSTYLDTLYVFLHFLPLKSYDLNTMKILLCL